MEVYSAGVAAPTPDGGALVFQRTNFRPLRASHLRIVGRQLGRSLPARPGIGRSARADARPSRARARRLARRRPDRLHRRQHRPARPGDRADRRRRADGARGRSAGACLRTVLVTRRAPDRLFALEAGRACATSTSSTWRRGVTARSGSIAPWTWIPSFSPDGRFVVFSSDRTGIYNLFAYELATERLYQVTNLVSGAFQPTVSPDGDAAWCSPGSRRRASISSRRRSIRRPGSWPSRSPTRAPTRCRCARRPRARSAPAGRADRREDHRVPPVAVLVSAQLAADPAVGSAGARRQRRCSDVVRRSGVQPLTSPSTSSFRQAATPRCAPTTATTASGRRCG